jgi:hypothetical protein
MKPPKKNLSAQADPADSRARRVADSILSDLGRLSTESDFVQDDEDEPGAYARTVLEQFKKGVAEAAAKAKQIG